MDYQLRSVLGGVGRTGWDPDKLQGCSSKVQQEAKI